MIPSRTRMVSTFHTPSSRFVSITRFFTLPDALAEIVRASYQEIAPASTRIVRPYAFDIRSRRVRSCRHDSIPIDYRRIITTYSNRPAMSFMRPSVRGYSIHRGNGESRTAGRGRRLHRRCEAASRGCRSSTERANRVPHPGFLGTRREGATTRTGTDRRVAVNCRIDPWIMVGSRKGTDFGPPLRSRNRQRVTRSAIRPEHRPTRTLAQCPRLLRHAPRGMREPRCRGVAALLALADVFQAKGDSQLLLHVRSRRSSAPGK